MSSLTVYTSYQFLKIPAETLPSVKARIEDAGALMNIEGLILISEEGINFTYAGLPEDIEKFTAELRSIIGAAPFDAKYSSCEKPPFKRLKVDIRREIVTFDGSLYYGNEAPGTHLSPAEWHKTLQSEDVLIVDVRNKYETAIGMFRGAVDPETQHFSEFVDFIKKWEVPRDKKILTYCTGGVRCEKAVAAMQREGYSQVYQLQGGILNYLKEFPEGEFKGECFVFDHRVSVDGRLNPSTRYSLCPHCGNPGETPVECSECGGHTIICENCAKTDDLRSCSKNCAHHIRRKSTAAA